MSKYKSFENIRQVFEPKKWFDIEEGIFRELEEKCFRYKGDYNLVAYFNETLSAYSYPEKMAILKDLEGYAQHQSNWSGRTAHSTLKDYISYLESISNEIPTSEKKSTIEQDMPLVFGKKQTAVADLIEAYYLHQAGDFDFNSAKAFMDKFGNASAYNAKKAFKHEQRLSIDYLPLTKWVANYRLMNNRNAQKIALQEIENEINKNK